MTLDRKLIKVVLLTSVFVYRAGKNPLVADGGEASVPNEVREYTTPRISLLVSGSGFFLFQFLL